MRRERLLSILRDVKAGRITVEEAFTQINEGISHGESSQPKNLRIVVYENGDVKTNLTFPLALARFAVGMLPKQRLQGVDPNQIDALLSEVRAGYIGKLIEINDGSIRTEIFSES